MVPSLQQLPDRHLYKIASSCDIQNDPGFRLMCKQGRLCQDMSDICTLLCCLQFYSRCCKERYSQPSCMDLEVSLKNGEWQNNLRKLEAFQNYAVKSHVLSNVKLSF